MNSIVPVLCAIFFISVPAKFLNVLSGSSAALYDNTTGHRKSWEATRPKRSLFETKPNVLTMNVEFETGEIVDLKLYKRSQHLANKHLPVVTPLLYHNPNLMEDIGEFISYQDIARCAALMYFEKTNSLYGMIGMNYYVKNIPFIFDENGHYAEIVRAPYLVKRADIPAHIHPIKIHPLLPGYTDVPQDQPGPSGYGQDEILLQFSDFDTGPSSKRQRTERNSNKTDDNLLISGRDFQFVHTRKRRDSGRSRIYHLEVLVFITRDVSDDFKALYGQDRYLQEMLQYYILYFNAIEMVFQKLYVKNTKLHINFAKIEIEDELKPFDFISDGDLIFHEVIDKVPQYLQTYPIAYPPDSFDLVFISTSRPILHQSARVPGATKYGDNLYEARMRNEYYNVVPITILGFHEAYTVAVHEISKIFGIRTESWLKGLHAEGQCHSIMQDGSSRCDRCLRWSQDNVREFAAFLSENKNNCFLLNYPRSLHPPGKSVLVTPDRQCKCYGYDFHMTTRGGKRKIRIGANMCSKNLQCQKGIGIKTLMESTTRPFDGTPCTDVKVCWDGECVPFPPNLCKIRL